MKHSSNVYIAFVSVDYGQYTLVHGFAISGTGKVLTSHVSSSLAWARNDLAMPGHIAEISRYKPFPRFVELDPVSADPDSGSMERAMAQIVAEIKRMEERDD